MVPFKSRTLADAITANPELEEVYQTDGSMRQLVDNAQALEGIVPHVSTHAAGVLIADEPLAETVPLQRPARGDENSPVMMTQYSMDPVAKLGLLKMDFLGLTNLTILDRTIKLLDEERGIRIDLSRLTLEDPETYELLGTGNTSDLFQLESAGMQRYIKELKPSDLGDIAAMIALYRPGPMEHIDRFIRSKHGRERVSYPHPSMKELLDETYGVIVYQDQVLHILQNFAGYSLGEADTVRKAMGKKIPALMAEERERFVSGAVQQGYTEEMGVEIFSLIEPFAGYAFNKAHSVSYGLISYWTAYFKKHHPLEYMASVLNCRLDHGDRYVASINECTRMGIEIRLPDVNGSGVHYTLDKPEGKPENALRIGLAAIKTVGEAAVTPIVTERQSGGPYTSISDFCRRVDVSGLNRRTLEGLAKAGAFDSLAPRAAVISTLDRIWAVAQQETRNRNSGQVGMFGEEVDTGAGGTLLEFDAAQPDYTPQEKAALEKEYLGVALSYNPLLALAAINPGDAYNSVDQLHEDMISSTVTLLGHVAAVSERMTRDNRRFLRVDLALVGGQVETMVWPDSLEKTVDIWQPGTVARVTGRLQIRGDDFSIACYDAQEYELPDQPVPTTETEQSPASVAPRPARNNGSGNGNRNGAKTPAASPPPVANGHRGAGVLIKMVETDDPDEDRYRLRQAIRVMLEYTGDDKVYLELNLKEKRRVLMEIPTVSTAVCAELQQRVQEVLSNGETCCEYQGSTA